ncbi:hypothetical protein K5X82_14945 [Halosquirtibacter xylanolyticus]|uniref:hypothetical protein n=1 Tax=Halosquirtibacter xylanolyticus TaxID=3374599 RepID=UPI0037488A8E|nr:hypothetical protein K5X82_14945 [Prolixibacteraceae bacterium]
MKILMTPTPSNTECLKDSIIFYVQQEDIDMAKICFDQLVKREEADYSITYSERAYYSISAVILLNI